MNEHLEVLQKKWLAEIAGWEHCAELGKSDAAMHSRCVVRAQTLQGCLDDLKITLRK